MVNDEELTITCPHCSTLISFNDEGDAVCEEQEELKPNESIGIGGLRVKEIGDRQWKNEAYKRNSQRGGYYKSNQPQPDAASGVEVEEVVEPNPVYPDDNIQQEVIQDLRKRGLN